MNHYRVMYKTPSSLIKMLFAIICVCCILISCKKNNPKPISAPCNGGPVFKWTKVAIVSDGLSNYFDYALAADNKGNVYVATENKGTIDADPGDGVLNLTGPGVVLQKLDTAGRLVWAKEIPLPSQGLKLDTLMITVDADRNVFVATSYVYISYYIGRVTQFDEDGNNIPNNTIANGYLMAVDKTQHIYQSDGFSVLEKYKGNVFFYEKEVVSGNLGARMIDIEVGNTGNIYMLGAVYDSYADFDPGSGEARVEVTEPLPVGSQPSLHYLQKLDEGLKFVWVKQVGVGLVADEPLNMLLDRDENIFINRMDATDWRYNILKKISPAGNLLWEKKVIKNGSMALDADNNVYLAGYLQWEKYDPAGKLAWSAYADDKYKGHLLATADGKNMYSLFPDTDYPYKTATLSIRRFVFCGK